MAKKRKRAVRKLRANPSSPKFRAGVMVPVRGVKINKRGVVQEVIIEDRNMGKALKRGKR